MSRVVRSSKFRHVFGTPYKKERCYDNIRITKAPWESNMCDVNIKFLAVVLESQGGGAFLVVPLEKVGRFDLNYPKVCGHKGLVLDIAWNPFDDNMIASCSEDCTVKLWHIPDGGLSGNLEDCEKELMEHQRKVGNLQWHPTAKDVLASSGADQKIVIWNVRTGEPLFDLDGLHGDAVYAMSWNYDGSLLATTCKDKKIRVIDPRSQTVVSEAVGHSGNKPSRAVFCGRLNRIFSTGFSRSSERQYALWNPSDMSKPLTLEEIDSGSGVLFPFHDDGTNMVYIAGKGDSAIKYFEVVDDPPYVHFLNMYQSKDPQRGCGSMAKRHLEHMQCEVMRFYKLHNKGMIEPISMTVPRKSEMFQDDIYPPCPAGVPALSAEEWASGVNKNPVLVTITKDGLAGTTTASAAPIKTSRTLVKQSSQGSTSSGSSSRPRSVSPEHSSLTASGEDSQLAKENQRLKSEVQSLQAENRRLQQQLKEKEDVVKKIRQLVN